MASNQPWLVLCLLTVCLLAKPSFAFGAGNIASISAIEGHNWRHGDIEDVLKTVACLKGYKWTSMMVKRVYFGNWLRDYSQAVDVGTLKGTNKEVIRILIWILGFMSFGYATEEFEVTEERLGTYRPEEHIDNPKDYADNVDARQYDPRLRAPVQPEELAIDADTGMKNYIANERGGWATSLGYVKHSFRRSIHFGRVFTSGASGTRGREADLCEALRCLGQGLHCLEDFGAHTNYTELSLRELGLRDVFPYVGSSAGINLRGKHVFPLVTGTFGGVDFLHSVLGEVTDHVTQTEAQERSELDQLGRSLGESQSRGGSQSIGGFTSLLSQIPGTGDLCREAESLQRDSSAQSMRNSRGGGIAREGTPPPTYSSYDPHASSAPSASKPSGGSMPAQLGNIDLQATVKKIYPILVFRDNLMRFLNRVLASIPGLESLVEKISESITLFIMSLLAPYIIPVINLASKQLKVGSSAVVDASGKHQYEVWEDPRCNDPTHSLLSKDHFSNILNEPAGQVAAAILQYVAPRIVYAWDHPDVPVEEVLEDIGRVFHHPAVRDQRCEVHQKMFSVVERWLSRQNRGEIERMLTSDSVKRGGNHKTRQTQVQSPGFGGGDFGIPGLSNILGTGSGGGGGGGFVSMITGRRDLDDSDFATRDGGFSSGTNPSYDSDIGREGPGGPMSGNYGQHQHNQFGGQYQGGQMGYDAYAPPRQQYGQPGYGQPPPFQQPGPYGQQGGPPMPYGQQGPPQPPPQGGYGGYSGYPGQQPQGGSGWGDGWGGGRR